MKANDKLVRDRVKTKLNPNHFIDTDKNQQLHTANKILHIV